MWLQIQLGKGSRVSKNLCWPPIIGIRNISKNKEGYYIKRKESAYQEVIKILRVYVLKTMFQTHKGKADRLEMNNRQTQNLFGDFNTYLSN